MDTSTDRTPRPTAAADKRRRILVAARALFARQGFDAARMDEVARRARVSKGTVYRHFASKETLLVEAVLHAMHEARSQVQRFADPDARADRALVATLRALLIEVFPDIVGERTSLAYQVWSLVARDASARERVFDAFREFYRSREENLSRPIAAGASAGSLRADLDPDEVALLLLSAFDGLVYRAMFDLERIDPERVLNTLLRLLEGGIRRASEPMGGDGA